ncbi:hypothetical protein V3595_02990 [Bacillus sp. CFBP9009]
MQKPTKHRSVLTNGVLWVSECHRRFREGCFNELTSLLLALHENLISL